jgi:hypothetical protein
MFESARETGMHALYALKRRNTMPFDPAPSDRTRRAHLPRRGSLVLDGAEGTIIAVDSGCLWVTLEHDPRDIVLAPGMRFKIDRPGRTVIAAEEDSRVRLTRGLTTLERIAAWLPRACRAVIRGWSRRLSRLSVPYY